MKNSLRKKMNHYIPLVELKVDVQRIKKEIMDIVKPKQFGSFALTVTEQLAQLEEYDFMSYMGITTEDDEGVRRFADGKVDTDLIYYPKSLEGSYIQEVEQRVSKYLGLGSPRVRMSMTKNNNTTVIKELLPYHLDPHTTYRVHVALVTSPGTTWEFKSGDVETSVHQPVDGVPVLIDTETVLHAVKIDSNSTRFHFWLQYHKHLDPEKFHSILEKSYKQG